MIYSPLFANTSNETLVIIIICVVVDLLCGIAAGVIGVAKGRSFAYFFLGIFLNIIGIIIVACLSSKNEEKLTNLDIECPKCHHTFYVEKDQELIYCPKCGTQLKFKNIDIITCPSCHKVNKITINSDVVYCKYCGNKLKDEESDKK